MAPTTTALDKDILDTLTDEEREAMQQDDVPGSEGAAASAGAADADAEGDDKDDDEGGAPIEGKGASDKAGDAEDKAAETTPAAEPPAPRPAPAPAYSFKLPDDFADKVAAVKEKEGALWSKFNDGEISREELQQSLGDVVEERQSLNAMQLKAELAADMQRQQMEQSRDQAVNALFTRAAAADGGGIDYRKDDARRKDLDGFLKVLAADEANEDKSLQWFLDEAHKRVLALNGIAVSTKPAVDPKIAAANAVAARKADTTGLNATLAHVPGGQGTGDVGGEFDDVLTLDGEAFEEALNEMARKNPQRFARFQATTRL